MFIYEYIINNLEIIYSFIGMIIVYFISYTLTKGNKVAKKDIKRVKWMAFGIALVIVGIARVLLLSD